MVPFTPVHRGPGILAKALLRGSFRLMVFGWAQIMMDIQPLIAIITGEGTLHGFTHTYAGATLISGLSAVSAKYPSQWGLVPLSDGEDRGFHITWRVVFLSANFGTYSLVLLDSIVHGDMEPLSPFSQSNG